MPITFVIAEIFAYSKISKKSAAAEMKKATKLAWLFRFCFFEKGVNHFANATAIRKNPHIKYNSWQMPNFI